VHPIQSRIKEEAVEDNPFEDVERVEINEATLAYREVGEGEPVVFVHGGLSDLRTWDHNVPEIGRSYRAIAYSRRYARPNDDIDPDAADPWERHVDDLAAFLQKIDAAPAHVIGNSQGAFISLLAAIRTPEVVRTLVLEEPPVIPLFTSFPPRISELIRLFVTRPRTGIAILHFILGAIAPTTKAFERGDGEVALNRFLVGVLGKRDFDQITPVQWERLRANISTLRAGMLHPAFPAIEDDEVRGLAAPTLLLTGERSPAVLLRLTDRLEELLPDVERLEIRDASHVMHEDNPPVLNQAILGFLGRHSAPAS
jgi:pimeloyl-ACP methyl ester carboxylesterase